MTYPYGQPFYPSPISPASASTSLSITIPFPKLRECTTTSTPAFAATPARQTQYPRSGFNGNHIKDPDAFNFLQPGSISAPEATFIKNTRKKKTHRFALQRLRSNFSGKTGRLHLPMRDQTPENQRKKACKTKIINYFLTELNQQRSLLNFFAVNEGADPENCEACTNYKQR